MIDDNLLNSDTNIFQLSLFLSFL